MKNDRKQPLSLATKIFLGLGLGIVVGVFFGEQVAFLHVAGEAFIQLLQMAVIPIVALSLIDGLGRLSYDEARSLAKKCGILLLLLWAIALAMVSLMPLAFPDWKSASFFSTTLIAGPKAFNFLELYIPANPFHALSESIVPAVVLFSIAVGVALIGIDNKQGLLDTLSTLLQALSRVTGFVIQLAPIGVFAIAASAAGTINLQELGRLQVYLLTFIAVAIVLTFWILPVLVTIVTPLTYREVLTYARSALITAFATGNLLVVLPLLAGRGKELLKTRELHTQESDSAMDVIVPISFTFPTIGLLLSLSFVPFAGWYVGSSLSIGQYPAFLVSGLASFFGGAVIAMPFLFDLLQIPADMFQLFITIDVLSSRFGTLLAAMHVWVLALLGTCAMTGLLTLRWKKVLQYGVVTLVLTLATIGGMRGLFTYGFDPEYTKYKSFAEMKFRGSYSVATTVLKETSRLPPHHDPTKSRLEEIHERGSLRVGNFKDALPFAFRNAAGNLVGFDMEMATLLAKALGVTLELVRIDRDKMAEELNAGYCDIIMSGVAITMERAQKMTRSNAYMNQTLAFIVDDPRREEFASWEGIRSLGKLRIGIPAQVPYYISLIQDYLPRAKIVPVASPREFFTKSGKTLDAFVYSAEAGSAWTLVYPAFSVVVPLPDPVAVPLAYLMPRGDRKMADYVNTWIELKHKDQTISKLFDHWILGKGAAEKEPRWSVIRNVLYWVD